MDSAQLIQRLEDHLAAISTHSLDLSFNELYEMYVSSDKELDIRPDYQRTFRWSLGAQSRFIETLLLELPIPPIYVIEDDVGRYELIDGLQRISTYLHFRGVLDSPDSFPPVARGEALELYDCDIVPELNGMKFVDLPTAAQIRLKRAFVNVKVIRRGSDPRMKYHMFKRLNTGGVLLSDQQIRNSTIRLLGPKFVDFLIELQSDANFQDTLENLSTERRQDLYDQELVLRFFALKNNLGEFRHDVADFLTDFMERVTDEGSDKHISFQYSEEAKRFRKTFEVLNRLLGASAFAYVNAKRPEALVAGFGVYHYEALTIGIQESLEKINLEDLDSVDAYMRALMSIKKDPDFVKITTGGGKNSPGPLAHRIRFVRERLAVL